MLKVVDAKKIKKLYHSCWFQ